MDKDSGLFNDEIRKTIKPLDHDARVKPLHFHHIPFFT